MPQQLKEISALKRTKQLEELKDLASLLTPGAGAVELEQDELLAKLNYHGITLLAAEQNSLPTALTAHIAKHKAMMVANDTLKRIELAQLINSANQASLRSVLFKGSALAYTLYSKSWLRPRSDNDILVAASDRAHFEQLLTELGYQKLFAIQGKYVSYQSTYGKALVGGSTINIDLHWHINNRQMFTDTFTVAQLIEHGQQLTHFDKTCLQTYAVIPSAVDSLLIACVHRSGHHQNEERLTWLYDIHLLARSLTDEQWQLLCQQASEKQISAITLNALQTCQFILKTEVNSKVLQQLQSAAMRKEPSAIFLNRELSERHYFWADIKSMPSLIKKLGFLRETTLPSPNYVRQQMNTRSATLGYLKRLYRGLIRVF